MVVLKYLIVVRCGYGHYIVFGGALQKVGAHNVIVIALKLNFVIES